ncbi:MAG: hypothetical protein IJZ28_01625 [Clostridia bacterium]|nr:hypothetical protein [Clostridia bacterium]
MNGKLKKYFEGAGLHINGNYAYGMLNNYEINVQVRVLDTVAPVLIHVSCFTTQVQKMQIDAELRAEKIKQLNYQFTPYGITLGLNDFTVGALVKRLDRDLGRIFAIISQNGALGAGYCPVCGNPLDFADSKKANVEGFTISIDNTCVQEINAVIAEDEQEFQSAPNNYPKGLVGALIGGLAGAAVAFVLYIAGFISALSAFVSFFVGALLYQKFGGKKNGVMIGIVTAVTLVAMVLSVYGVYLVECAAAAEEYGLQITAKEAFDLCWEDAEFRGAFWGDMAMTLFFTVIAAVYEIIRLSKQIKRRSQI